MSRRKISEQVTVGVLDKEWELAEVIPCLLGKKEAQLNPEDRKKARGEGSEKGVQG